MKTNGHIFKIILLSLFSVGYLAVPAHEKVIDSLRHSLQTIVVQDSNRVKVLIEISHQMTYSDPDAALVYMDEALTLSKRLNWKTGTALCYRMRGMLFYVKTDFKKAMSESLKALKIAEEIDHKEISSSVHNNLGNIYADMEEYDQAIVSYMKYLEFARKSKNIPGEIIALVNIGLIKLEIDKINEGIEDIKSALSLAENEKYDFYLPAIVSNLGLAYKTNKEYDAALVNFERARSIALESGNKQVEAVALNNIARINLILNDVENAEANSANALSLAEESSSIKWQSESWEILSKVYESQGKFEESMSAYKSFISLRDSILNEDKRAELTRQEMQFKMDNQEALSQEKIKRQALIKKISIAGGLILLLGAFINYRLYKKRRDILDMTKVAEFKTKVAETELVALRSQVNPHFIFNSLNSISDYMHKNDLEKADDYLVKFSKLMRSILENSEKKWVSLKEDIELMELYIQIESLRLKDKITYSINVSEEIDQENVLIPPLIVQPSVENSVWHGIAKKKESGKLTLNIWTQFNNLMYEVVDDGVGRSIDNQRALRDGPSGERITKNRLDIINELYDGNASINYVDMKNGLKVIVQLPLRIKYNG